MVIDDWDKRTSAKRLKSYSQLTLKDIKAVLEVKNNVRERHETLRRSMDLRYSCPFDDQLISMQTAHYWYL
jgi:hypothetical protein